jgi:hypothetical protein
MKRLSPLAALGLVVALTAAALAATPPKAGTYELAVINPTGGMVYALVKITPKGGGIDGELVAMHPDLDGLELKGVALDGDTLRVTLKGPANDLTFEGRVPAAGAETVLGAFEVGNRLQPVRLARTEKTDLTPATARVEVALPEPMRQARALSLKGPQLNRRAQQTQDADEKAKLLKEAAEAVKEAQTEVPKLYREVLEKHADSPAAVLAAQSLLRQAGKNKESADTVARWAAVVMKNAQPYGPRYEGEAATQLAEVLAPQSDYAATALEYAQRAEKVLAAKDPAARQIRVLNVLAAAQKKAGKSADTAQTTARVAKIELAAAQRDEKALAEKDSAEKQESVLGALAVAQRKAGLTADAQQTESRLAKIQSELDRQYLEKMPPFKPEPFTGRKEKGDRAVVMELFTGAECPPCVAADVAFDALEKTYKPTEVVLIQYHLHIPGPDPLTNATTEARQAYYKVGSTPTTLFNGKRQAGGGGGIGNAEKKFKEYREIIDDLIESPAKAAVTVDASRQGETVTVRAAVSNLADPGEDKRLRLLLVEEAVRYAGGNKLRFHHMVVRAMPGGPDGFKLTDKESKHTATVNLDELRKELNQYLDTFAEEKRPFPRPDRPMAMKHLKVIALVQDDKTNEILQAAVADLGGERAAK